MMNATQCRTKARDAYARATIAPDSAAKHHCEVTAREWAQLAATAEAQEALQRTLLASGSAEPLAEV
jgi:hypothetical protein